MSIRVRLDVLARGCAADGGSLSSRSLLTLGRFPVETASAASGASNALNARLAIGVNAEGEVVDDFLYAAVSSSSVSLLMSMTGPVHLRGFGLTFVAASASLGIALSRRAGKGGASSMRTGR